MRPRPYEGAIGREKTIVRASVKNPAPAVRDAGKPLLVIGLGASCRRWLRPQAVDQLEDFHEYLCRQGNLGHLERNFAAAAEDLCTDLDHILTQVVSETSARSPAAWLMTASGQVRTNGTDILRVRSWR